MKKWLLLLLAVVMPASAMTWQDFWLRPDQQGMRLLNKGQAQQAAQTFKDPRWQAAAHYRAGNYQQAEQWFAKLATVEAEYNRGNAKALQGDYQAALAAYDEVLKKNPQHQDAAYNREIVKKLLQQQNQPSSNSQQTQAGSRPNSAAQPANSATQSPAKPRQDHSASGQSSSAAQSPAKPRQDHSASGQSSSAAQSPAKPEQGHSASAQSKPEQAPSAKPEQSKDNAAPVPPPPSDPVMQSTPAHETTAKPAKADEDSTSAQRQQQSNEQWLRQIPDDPGGLLRQKFLRDHQRMKDSSH